MGILLQPSIQFQKNRNQIDLPNSFEPGDHLSITILSELQDFISIIEIKDPNKNRRIMCRYYGEQEFSTILPQTSLYGSWLCEISITHQGTTQVERYEMDVSLEEPEESNDTKESKNDSFLEGSEESSEEEVNIVHLQQFQFKDQLEILNNITGDADLFKLQPFKLSVASREELEIPIAEMHQITLNYQIKLNEADVYYISDLLERDVNELVEITKTTYIEIKSWLKIAIEIYNTPNHELRLEYRRIRYDYLEYQKQLDTLSETKKAHDPLSELVGVNKESIRKLKNLGIETVNQLLRKRLVDLINYRIDRDNPLSAKMWIKNAKSYLAIK